ncbi:MAG: GNAT family N-acetyltransferase [Anaerolineales bacterium]|nr:GNAT family N-acetyltransferase [Anaerolineales bacterium]
MIFGERIRLRALEREDLPRFVEWFHDPEVRAGISLFMPLSLAEEEQWYEEMIKKDPIEHTLSVDVRNGEEWTHVGNCGLFDLEPQSRRMELGVIIGERSSWDQGFGTDVVRTLLGHAFETLNLNRVVLRVYETNLRAIQVYKKIGFIEEGRLRQDHFIDGKYVDVVIMGVLCAEWKSMEKGKG